MLRRRSIRNHQSTTLSPLGCVRAFSPDDVSASTTHPYPSGCSHSAHSRGHPGPSSTPLRSLWVPHLSNFPGSPTIWVDHNTLSHPCFTVGRSTLVVRELGSDCEGKTGVTMDDWTDVSRGTSSRIDFPYSSSSLSPLPRSSRLTSCTRDE